MGESPFGTRLWAALFAGLAPWAGLLPGRLLRVDIAGRTVFAAISGSSAAIAQVVGRPILRELLHRGRGPTRRPAASPVPARSASDPASGGDDRRPGTGRRIVAAPVHRGADPRAAARRLLLGRELVRTALRTIAFGTVQTGAVPGIVVPSATVLGNVCAVLGAPDAAAARVPELCEPLRVAALGHPAARLLRHDRRHREHDSGRLCPRRRAAGTSPRSSTPPARRLRSAARGRRA
jgi:hypothetical protein